MRILLYILSLLALASCTIPGAITPPTNTPTTPVEPAKKSPVETTLYGSGKHIIQIYADFQCPACIAFSQNYTDIFEAYATSGKVQLQFKQYPLTNMHKNAYRDALASLCASDQKKYGDYKVGLYALEKRKAGAAVSDAERIALARDVAMPDITAFETCLTSAATKARVDSDIAEGTALGVNGTPTVMLDGSKLDIGAIFADVTKGKAFMERVLAQ